MTHLEKILSMLRIAAESGTYNGQIRTPGDMDYFKRCSAPCRLGDLSVGMIYTRDIGHHEGGWWKNPQFERCYHLSMSFRDSQTLEPAPFHRDHARRVAKMMFGDHLNWVWVEPPFSDRGKILGVHHYRLFCDMGWQPHKPQGEVYSKELTPIGWKSFSELHGEAAAANVEHGPLGTAPGGE